MSIPREAQEKMINYNFVLSERYTPGIEYLKLSVGYSKSAEAAEDSTPISVAYTNNNRAPNLSSIINIDQNKSIVYDGGGLWYHVFDSSSVDAGYIILIDSVGIITNKITVK